MLESEKPQINKCYLSHRHWFWVRDPIDVVFCGPPMDVQRDQLHPQPGTKVAHLKPHELARRIEKLARTFLRWSHCGPRQLGFTAAALAHQDPRQDSIVCSLPGGFRNSPGPSPFF